MAFATGLPVLRSHRTVRVVFHPARLRKNLLVLFLRHGGDARGPVKHHESRARGALINCSDVVFHRTLPFCWL
jgi:hypothetical protein